MFEGSAVIRFNQDNSILCLNVILITAHNELLNKDCFVCFNLIRLFSASTRSSQCTHSVSGMSEGEERQLGSDAAKNKQN